MTALQLGDRAVAHDGEAVTVTALACNLCAANRAHPQCELWARVGPRRWINVDYLTKEED